MPGKKLWGGRFSSEQHPLFTRFNDSLPFDRELLESDIAGSLAYARALQRAGIFTNQERRRVEQGLRGILEEHRRNPRLIEKSKAEDVHTYVEQELARRAGQLALRLHTGRSRNDQVATDLRLYLRAVEENLEKELNGLLRTIAELAKENMTALLPGYTHLQGAQPVLFSHYMLAFGEMFLRDRERLRQARTRMNVCPLGSGALSGTVYDVDLDALARELGFASISSNSMDSVSDRDFVLDILFFSATFLVHLSRLAEDLILYNSAEFGFVTIDDAVASGSSLMPQKKNPDALELIRGKTGRVVGHLVAMLTTMKGLPMTYDKDLQEDKEALFDTIRTVDSCIRVMTLVLATLQVNSERMREAAARGYLNATELADYLVARGMAFREAHHLAGRLVRRALELELPLERLPLEEYHHFSSLFAEDVYTWLRLDRAVSRRKYHGGTALSSVRKALVRFNKRLAL